jgi:eukaryotic-like serine/threonine-protein kinase
MMTEPWRPRAGELVAERFNLLSQIGRGGMGEVWLAEHVTLASQCAVKFLLVAGDDESKEEADARFRHEARAVARLRSRHVVRVLDHGVWQGAPYFAMDLLVGESLGHRLERLGKLPAAHVVGLMRGVARALTVAAEAGIVHRDLKPENVFICREDAEEVTKVLDFGIAKSVSSSATAVRDHVTRQGNLMGTPHYMSPEQVDGTMPLDHRSDLWSASVMVFQCLTGTLPFDNPAVAKVMMHILAAPLPVPSELASELPATFDAWWTRAAAREPGERFQSAAAWYAALEESLGVTLPGSADVSSRLPALPSADEALAAAAARTPVPVRKRDDRSMEVDFATPIGRAPIRRAGPYVAAAALALVASAAAAVWTASRGVNESPSSPLALPPVQETDKKLTAPESAPDSSSSASVTAERDADRDTERETEKQSTTATHTGSKVRAPRTNSKRPAGKFDPKDPKGAGY